MQSRYTENDFLAYDRAYKAMYNRLRYLSKDEKFLKSYKRQIFRSLLDPCMKLIQEKQSYYEEKNDLHGFEKFTKETMKKYKVKKE